MLCPSLFLFVTPFNSQLQFQYFLTAYCVWNPERLIDPSANLSDVPSNRITVNLSITRLLHYTGKLSFLDEHWAMAHNLIYLLPAGVDSKAYNFPLSQNRTILTLQNGLGVRNFCHGSFPSIDVRNNNRMVLIDLHQQRLRYWADNLS